MGQMAYRMVARVGTPEKAARTAGTPQGTAESIQLQLGRLEEEGEFGS